jgi:hypothetical protein
VAAPRTQGFGGDDTEFMTAPEVTLLNEPWVDLRRCVAPIRAAASRHESALVHVDVVDLAAAAIGVEAWMFALRTTTLSDAAIHGRSATFALSRCMARAAVGRDAIAMSPAEERSALHGNSRPQESWFSAVEQWAARVVSWGVDPACVFRRAASDLIVGPANVQAMALLLADAAESPY